MWKDSPVQVLQPCSHGERLPNASVKALKGKVFLQSHNAKNFTQEFYLEGKPKGVCFFLGRKQQRAEQKTGFI